jgi:NAD(P)-dependent dehydrogenase (short-subunit alcohol dehydrogenase family)
MAVRAMFDALAEELRPFGIRVASLLPDAVDTSLIAGSTLAPRGALAPERVGRFVAELLALPFDAALEDPLIAPSGSRTGGAPRRARQEGAAWDA